MALGRGEPLLQSLSQVGENLRAISGDILTRRRLDLSEQAQVEAATRERELAALRSQEMGQRGAVELLSTRGNLANLSQQMELRGAENLRQQAAEQRQQELHGPTLQSAQFTADVLNPLKAKGMQADIAQSQASAMASRAAAGASAASARLSDVKSKVALEEFKFLQMPMKPEGVAAMAKAGWGDTGLDLVKNFVDPAEVKTVGGGIFIGNALTGILGKPERERRTMKASEVYQQELHNIRGRLNEALAKGDAKAVATQSYLMDEGFEHLKLAMGAEGGDPDKVAGVPGLVSNPAVEAFRPIAKQVAKEDVRFKGLTEGTSEYNAALESLAKSYVLQYGTVGAFREATQQAAAARQQDVLRTQPQPPGQPTGQAARPQAPRAPAPATPLQQREQAREQQAHLQEAISLQLNEQETAVYLQMRNAGYDSRAAYNRLLQARPGGR